LPPPGKELLNADQMAERLQVSVPTFRRMVAAGEFPQPMRRNRKWSRWLAKDADEYVSRLDQQRQGKRAARGDGHPGPPQHESSP
jgi:excisionase family DNA binding protein